MFLYIAVCLPRAAPSLVSRCPSVAVLRCGVRRNLGNVVLFIVQRKAAPVCVCPRRSNEVRCAHAARLQSLARARARAIGALLQAALDAHGAKGELAERVLPRLPDE